MPTEVSELAVTPLAKVEPDIVAAVTVIASATFASVTALLLIFAVVTAESVIPPVLIFVRAIMHSPMLEGELLILLLPQ